MTNTTILQVEDRATDEARPLCALNQYQMGEKVFVTGDKGTALDFLSGRHMQ